MRFSKYLLIIVLRLNQTTCIVGGMLLSVGTFSGSVSLQRKGKHICGGLLFGTRVITAAHCVKYERTSELCVKTERIILEDNMCQNVQKTVIHPKYDEITSEFDIAVIDLNSGDPSFKPELASLSILFPSPNYKATGICIVTGYGAHSLNGPTSSLLYSALLPVVHPQDCLSKLGWFLAPQPGSSLFCAGGEGPDACTGDSGSPFLCLNLNRTSWIFAGIVSYGMRCGTFGIPGVYTQVSSSLNWLNKNMF